VEARFEPAKAADVLDQMLEGVAAAHHAGIVHRSAAVHTLYRILTTLLLFALVPARAFGQQSDFWSKWFARVDRTQAAQPHWVTGDDNAPS
jgi:hypothetical protein